MPVNKPRVTVDLDAPQETPWASFLRYEAGSIQLKTEMDAERVVYIATRRKSAVLKDLFESMRDDMKNGLTVALIVDRRDPVPCVWFGREQPDRRRRELDALALNGWARIVVGGPDDWRDPIAVPVDVPPVPAPLTPSPIAPPQILSPAASRRSP
jgi:hypothetical protein